MELYSFEYPACFQAAQQITELNDASQINMNLNPAQMTKEVTAHDVKAIVKTWR